MSQRSELVRQRYQKLEEIQELGCDPYPHRYDWDHTVADLLQAFSGKTAEELEAAPARVRTPGRIMALRGHGKAAFGHIDGGGKRIQFYIRQDRVGEENFRLFQLLDLGDLVGLRGTMFRTRTGELSILVEELTFLSKSLLPLPEKWHGLTDVELRYRQRHLDLLVNPEIREIFLKRSRIIGEIRRFLESKGYLEVETPMMQPVAGGAAAKPFRTFHEALGIPLFLRIAPELYLKRLVVGGFDRVFEINRNFRNEGISTQHNPEFTMLEFYQAYSDYRDLMGLTEELLQSVVSSVQGSLQVEYGGQVLDFGRFQRFSMIEAIEHFWDGEGRPAAEDLKRPDCLAQLLKRLGVDFGRDDSWGGMLGLLFETVVEKRLIQPTFVYDFPADLSPLSKRRDDDPRFAERFELFVGGLEIANAYSELNDPEEQKRRFEEQLAARERGDEEAHQMDEDYVRALRHGMPPAAGEGIGIDRLTMLVTDSRSIREVILFPHLRPEAGL
jgi:lysyl-tRNA synthetase, class II